MRRGFKSQAEVLSIEARKDLGLSEVDPLDPWKYAGALGAIVLKLDELDLSQEDADQLLKNDSKSWSGLTIKEAGFVAVIINESHSLPRQRSTLMHELAHIQLNHLASRVDIAANGLLLVSDYSAEQEDEANWLSGALLLPRGALLQAHTGGRSSAAICDEYGVSNDLCLWRLRMTGIMAEVAARRARSA